MASTEKALVTVKGEAQQGLREENIHYDTDALKRFHNLAKSRLPRWQIHNGLMIIPCLVLA